MRMLKINLLVFIFNIYFLASFVHGSNEIRKSYIVYMEEAQRGAQTHAIIEGHDNLLLSAIGDHKLARESKICSYGKSFNGFAAKLLPHEAKRLSDEHGVISVFSSTWRKLHTTRSWDFLGISETTTKRNPSTESNIIVGL